MKLSIAERLMVAQLLPEKGSFINLGLIRKAKEDVSFSDKEHADLHIIITDEGRVTWVDPDNYNKDIEFGEIVTAMIVKRLKTMDEQEELEEKYFTVYKKFVA